MKNRFYILIIVDNMKFLLAKRVLIKETVDLFGSEGASGISIISSEFIEDIRNIYKSREELHSSRNVFILEINEKDINECLDIDEGITLIDGSTPNKELMGVNVGIKVLSKCKLHMCN